MGRDATKAAGNPWYQARKKAAEYDDRLCSRESAAEQLGMSVRNSDGTVSQPTGTTVEAVFYRLADYEDTNREPAEIRKLEREYRTAVNELCYMCGKYKQEHEGACRGCRWKKPV